MIFSNSFFTRPAGQIKAAQKAAKTHLSGGDDVCSDELHHSETIAKIVACAYRKHGVKAVDAAIKAGVKPAPVKVFTAAEIAAMGY